MTDNPKKIGTGLIYFELWSDGLYYLRHKNRGFSWEEIIELKTEIENHASKDVHDDTEWFASVGGAHGCHDGE